MHVEPFLKPRLIGKRFDGGAIPLEVLADFAVLSDLLVEAAKSKFRTANPDRKRVPRGFKDGITLKLTAIREGSAILEFGLTLAAAPNLFGTPTPTQTHFGEARSAFINVIKAAEQDRGITDHLPRNLLGYFNRLDRNLANGETIEFTDVDGREPARFTRETRRRLI